MGLSLRTIFFAAYGLVAVLTACGDGDGKNTERGIDNVGNGDGADGGGTNVNGGQNNGGGPQGNGGTTGPAACMPAQCTCANGMMGFAQCEGDTLGACTCGIDLSDAGLPAVAECTGNFTCNMAPAFLQGLKGFCTPAAAAAGDGGASTGGTTGGGGIPGGGGAPALPPMCETDEDCDTAGIDVKCSAISAFGQTFKGCIQPCEP